MVRHPLIPTYGTDTRSESPAPQTLMRLASLSSRWRLAIFQRSLWMLIAIAAIVIPISSATRGDQLALIPIDCPSDYFGGQPVKWELELASEIEQDIEIQWSIQVNSRTWARRSYKVNAQANKPHLVDIEFETPPTKDGIAIQATVKVKATGQVDNSSTDLSRQICFFAKDPFFASSKWLQQLDISLVDSAGKTAALLESMSVPFRMVHVDHSRDETGLLVVGELTPWNQRIESMVLQAVRDGRPVLCFATPDAQLDLMQFGTEQPPNLSLHSLAFVNQLDKRLNIDRCELLCSCNLVHQNEKLLARMSPNGQGWSFLELTETRSKGHLILCGITIRPNTSPTETFLLARLLERLYPNQQFSTELRK